MRHRPIARAAGTALSVLLLSAAGAAATGPGSARAVASAPEPEPPSVHAAEAAAHEHDRLSLTPGRRVDVPLAPRARPRPTSAEAEPAPRAASTLRRAVFGFLPSWEIGSSDLRLDYAGLTTIAIFGVQATKDGHLDTHDSNGRPTNGWAAWWSTRASQIITDAHRVGTRVVLTVQRFAWTPGQTRDTEALLGSATRRQRLAGDIAEAIEDRGGDGVNLDFEPIPLSQRENFVTFVREVRTALDARRPGLELTFDATRNEWLAGYDLAGLTAPGAADAVFLMGYEYSGSGATRSGASAPIRRVPGSLGPVRPYEDDDLTRTLEAYLDQAAPGKVILGLPWYGRSWATETDTFPSPTLAPASVYGKSGVWLYGSAMGVLAEHGHQYASTEATGWTAWRTRACDGCPVAWRQLVIDDARSFTAKLDLADRYALQGVGIWALGYDGTRPELRNAIRARYIPQPGADTDAPSGTVRISRGAPWTGPSPVHIGVLALDDVGGRGIATVAISNTCRVVDGILRNARIFAYTGRVSWTLTAGEGPKTVCAQWRDRAGNRSAVRSDNVKVDLGLPSATAPTVAFEPDTRMDPAGVPLRISWTGSDALSGVAAYLVQQSKEGSDWSPVAELPGDVTTLPVRIARGMEHRFRTRAVDRAGNRSEWSEGEPFRVDLVQETHPTVALVGAWTVEPIEGASGGAIAWSETAGDTAAVTVTGRAVAWLGSQGPTFGEATVSLDGTGAETVDTFAEAAKDRRLLTIRSWPETEEHTLVVDGLATDTRPRIVVDAFLILH